MCFQIGRVDHDRLVFGALGGQAHHNPGEDPVLAPAFPAVVERLGGPVFPRRVAPSQTIAVDEDYAAQNTPVIDAGPAMALGKEGFEARHLRLAQPEKVAHQSGLLAGPESRQTPEINGSGA